MILVIGAVAALALLAAAGTAWRHRKPLRGAMKGAQLDALGMVWGAPRMGRETDAHYLRRLTRLAPQMPATTRVQGRLMAIATPPDRKIGR